MKLGITMLIHYKDDIEFVTEFPCLLGCPVVIYFKNSFKYISVKIVFRFRFFISR